MKKDKKTVSKRKHSAGEKLSELTFSERVKVAALEKKIKKYDVFPLSEEVEVRECI